MVKGRPCAVPADRVKKLTGLWYCHLHDPEGEHQAHLRAKHQRGKEPAQNRPGAAKDTLTCCRTTHARKPCRGFDVQVAGDGRMYCKAHHPDTAEQNRAMFMERVVFSKTRTPDVHPVKLEPVEVTNPDVLRRMKMR